MLLLFQSWKAITHHARFVRFLPVLFQFIQLELILQLPLQILLKALLIGSACRPVMKKQSSLKLGKKRDGCDWIVLYKSLIYDLRIKCLVYSKRWTAGMLYEIQLKFLNLHPLHWHFSQIKEKISSIHNKIPHFYNPYSSIILFKMITNKKKVHGLPLSK